MGPSSFQGLLVESSFHRDVLRVQLGMLELCKLTYQTF